MGHRRTRRPARVSKSALPTGPVPSAPAHKVEVAAQHPDRRLQATKPHAADGVADRVASGPPPGSRVAEAEPEKSGTRPVAARSDSGASDISENEGVQRLLLLGVVFLIAAIVLGVVGFRLTRTLGAPNFPITCLGKIDGRCHQEQSGLYLYDNEPSDPIALTVIFGSNVYGPAGTSELIEVGANVPASQTLKWMVELYGVPLLRPETFGPDIRGSRRQISLSGTPATLTTVHVSTPNSCSKAQVLEGTITGPTNGYSTLQQVATVPIGSSGNGIATVSGDASAPVVAQNALWILGDLPYLIATPPDQVPGTVAHAPEIVSGPLLKPGLWYYSKRALVIEEYEQPIASEMLYSESQPSIAGSTQWQSSTYAHGRFVLENIGAQDGDENRQFWAGIALGLAGGCAVAAIQTVATLTSKRRKSKAGARTNVIASNVTGVDESER